MELGAGLKVAKGTEHGDAYLVRYPIGRKQSPLDECDLLARVAGGLDGMEKGSSG